MHLRAALAAGSLLLLALPSFLRAQGWMVAAAAGRVVPDAVSARVGSTQAAVSVGYMNGVRWPWLYASAGRPLSRGGPPWVAAGTGGWLETARDGGLYAGLSVEANGYAVRGHDDAPAAYGGTAELHPTVGWNGGRAFAQASAGGVATGEAAGDSSDARAFLDVAARMGFSPAPTVRLTGEGRWVAGDDGDWTYAGARASLRRGPASAWGFAGAWLDEGPPSPGTAYGAGVTVQVARATFVTAEWRRDPADPVFLDAPRRAWTVQLRHALGGSLAARPRPAVAPEIAADGTVTFRLPQRDHARAPSLLGAFTGWQPVEMRAEGAFWVARVRVEPGVHAYGYRRWTGGFFVPAGLPATDDGMGGRSAVLVVP